MKYIENIDVKNKKVILRLDLNVTIKEGKIVDDTKIKKSIPTIKYLLDNNAHILIMSHLGKIKEESDKLNNSLNIVSLRLSELLNKDVKFISLTRGEELKRALVEHEITLMENTRFEDLNNKAESSCDEELSKYWASLGEVFINDAFGTTHRRHASNYGISKYLPSAYGFLINEELMGLEPIIKDIKKPFTVIMGGAKVDDKVALIKSLLEECDNLLVGGGIANTFLKASGYNIGNSLYSADYVPEIKELLTKYKDKIFIPNDVVVQENNQIYTCDIADIKDGAVIYDIGLKSIKDYALIIENAKTIFINGCVGMYEDANFRNGTNNLFQELGKSNAIKIAGGGDALASINKLGYREDFDFLSTGGGATLEYLATKKIKCFEDEI